MKVGLVYTSTTPELIADVEREVKAQLGDGAELYSQEDPGVIALVSKAGFVTAVPAARVVGMYMKAVEEGCDAILNICSSVGEVADAAQDLARCIGIPIVRIDEEMCRDAVRRGSRIGVMATLSTTLEPTKATIKRVAREMGRPVTLVDGLVDGACGLEQAQFRARLTESAAAIIDDVDIIVLAQGSMAYVAQEMTDRFAKPVLGSPAYGAAALKAALVAKGTIK